MDKFIIKSIAEENDAFVVAGGSRDYKVRKIDLRCVNLAEGDSVCVFIHPNYPDVVAGLNLDGCTVFHKSREEIIDEYLTKVESDLIEGLPEIAKHRLKMFEMFDPEFAKHYRLTEAYALSLAWELCQKCKSFKDIYDFDDNRSYEYQKEILPRMESPILPRVSASIIVLFALDLKADELYGISELRGINADKLKCSPVLREVVANDLANSAVMSMRNAEADSYGLFCVPREECIEKYAASI